MKYRVERKITVLVEVEAESEDQAVELTPIDPHKHLLGGSVQSVTLHSLKVWEVEARPAS